MLRTLKHLTITASLLAATTAYVTAQPVFVPPNAAEYTFGDPSFAKAQNTSCYSLEASYSYFPAMGLGSVNLYVAGWNSNDITSLQEVTVLLTDPNDPTNVLWKTSIPYTHVRDLQVGSIRNVTTNNTNIVVAYYKEGSGHMLDVYELSPSPTNPYNLVDHKTLSNSPTYGRISMTFHATYTGAVAWVNTTPGEQGIQAMVYVNDTWSNKSSLANTTTKTGVDIAITQMVNTTGYPLHFVYSGGGFITESTVDMNTLATSPGIQTPHINDNNYVGTGLISRLVLDCPDFSSGTTPFSSSWAYTYSDLMNIVVHHYNPAVGAQTVAVTSGMLGNSPLDPIGGMIKVYSPAINYGGGALGSLPEEIMVTWYATDGISTNGYMAVRMNTSGTAVTSTPDYLQLPNANTPSMPIGFTSGIALSKMGPKSVRDYLYATYYDVNPTTGEYQLHHAFHKFTDMVFKGGKTGLQTERITGAKLNVSPNPFSDIVLTTVTLRKAGVLHLQLHDVTGRLVWQNTSTLTQGEHQVKTESLKGLTTGTYMLTATLDNQKVDTKMVVKR